MHADTTKASKYRKLTEICFILSSRLGKLCKLVECNSFPKQI